MFKNTLDALSEKSLQMVTSSNEGEVGIFVYVEKDGCGITMKWPL